MDEWLFYLAFLLGALFAVFVSVLSCGG